MANPHQPVKLQEGVHGWLSEHEYRMPDGTVVRPEPVMHDACLICGSARGEGKPLPHPQTDEGHELHPRHRTPVYRLPSGATIHHGFGVPEVPPESRPPDLTRRAEYRHYMLQATSLADWEERRAHVMEAHGGRLPQFFSVDVIAADFLVTLT